MTKFDCSKLRLFIISTIIILILPEESSAQWVQTSEPNHYGTVLAASGSVVYAGFSDLYGTGHGGLYISADNGDTWTNEVNPGLIKKLNDTCSVICIAAFEGSAVAGTDSNGVFLLGKNSSSFENITGNLPTLTTGYYPIGAVALTGAGIYVASSAGTQGTVFFGGGGGTWGDISETLPSYGSTIGPYSVSALGAINGTLYGGVHNSGVYVYSGGWAAQNSGMPGTNVLCFGSTPNDIFAGTNGFLFRSVSGGSWTDVTPVQGGASVTGLASDGKVLFASCWGFGVFESTDDGNSWTEINTGFNKQAYNVSSLAITDKYLFAGTGNQGVWRRPLSDLVTSVNSNKENLLLSYKLDQNYPNPFNPSTVIRYSLSASGLVTLKTYNVLGEEVSTLVDKYQKPGYYSFKFNASKLASGIYFYRLSAEGNDNERFTEVKKMVLLK